MKRKGIGIAPDINHSIAEIRKPCAYPLANLLAEGILRPARIYSITKRILIAAYDIANLSDVSANAPCMLIVRVQLPSSEETPIDDGINRQSQT